jgi:hypothetical protein
VIEISLRKKCLVVFSGLDKSGIKKEYATKQHTRDIKENMPF